MNARKAFTLIELMIVVAIIGLLTAIAVPNFIRFQARSKQAEVKSNMKAIFTGQKSYYQARDTYSNLIVEVGFEPERNNRYCYDLGSNGAGVFQSRSGITLPTDTSPPTMTGIAADVFSYPNLNIAPVMPMAFTASYVGGSAGSFAATAAGNIDPDTFYDQWSISSQTRSSGIPSTLSTCAEGPNSDGSPCNDFNDALIGD